MNNIVCKLYFYQNNKLFQKIAVNKKNSFSLIVGSGPDANIKINNPRVSRHHVQIIFDNNKDLYIQDLSSLNGTLLNGNILQSGQPKLLQVRDKVQLAGVNGILIIVKFASNDNLTEDNSINILEKLKLKNIIFVGRDPSCDIVINSSTISRRHVSIERSTGNRYLLKDLNSKNGIYINGCRVKGLQNISLKDKVFIGRFQLSLDGITKDLRDELAISAVGIEKTYPNGTRALRSMDLSVPSSSLLAIMGPSGCGKSTLLKALNGHTPSTKGKIFLFNQELLSNYDYLKTQIGYVPQDDIIHKELTVYQSLFYAAKLRLDNPNDEIIEKKINEVLNDLGVSKLKNNLISAISGGERKRVSIAVELLTEPLILFLDEPTSPLDPQTIEDFLNILKVLSEKGTTVIMVTHKPEDLEYMDDVIFMAEGGNIVYYGDSKSYKKYFNVKTAVAVFSQISGESSSFWIRKFNDNKVHNNELLDNHPKKMKSSRNLFSQFYWLSIRYLRIKTNDKINSIVMLLQAPIIAILICVIFDEITPAVNFITAVSAIWFGANNAAREIVSENAIYKRERMFNLEIFPYIFSKITVLSFFAILQSLFFIIILVIKFESSELPINNPVAMFLWMSFLSIISTFLGLLLSAYFKTTEKVMTIVPIVLIPQIMLAGLVTKLSNEFVEIISYFTFSRWGNEGFSIIQKEIMSPITESPTSSILYLESQFHTSYKDIFGTMSSTILLDFIAISLMGTVLIFLIYKTLKQKDSVSL